MKEINRILQKSELVRTSCREEIIKVILESPVPLSEEEVKSTIPINFDRTTFYRTFKTLIAKEVIHKIVIDNTLVKYAITNKQKENEQHAHFYCLGCDKVFCIPEIRNNYSGLPANYVAKQSELLIKGLCEKCN